MAPDGQLCATWATVSADTVSGKIHSPGVLALNTVGASSTQWREWMQRLASNSTVTSRPLATSIFDSLGTDARAGAGTDAEGTAAARAASASTTGGDVPASASSAPC